jgi:subtilisin family serine protease
MSPGAGVPQPVLAGPDAIPGRYIVMLKDGVDSSVAAADMGRREGFAADTVYRSAVHGFAANMSDAEARALARDPSVALVAPDQRVSADLHNNLFQTVPTGVARIGADQNPTAHITNAPGGTNLNIDVAVIDTGVDTQHPELNVAGGVGLWDNSQPNCSGSSSYEDDNGHGTHVSGTIAAIDNDRGVVGVAPGARIWAVKVLAANGSGSDSCVIAGIDWVTQQRHWFNQGSGGIDIQVANMSLGGPTGGVPPSQDPMCLAIDRSVAAGVIYAVAAGNSASDASGYSPAHCTSPVVVSAFADFDGKPGALSPLTASFSCGDPAGPTVVHDDTWACFSNYGANVDIAAPGVNIVSTWKADPACGNLPYCYATLSGTSMATPHVTGALALFLLATRYSGSAQASAVMNAFTAAGYTRPQNSPCGFTGDPGSEPVLYVGNSCAGGSTPSPTASPSPSPSPSPTSSPTPTPTHSPTPTPTPSPTPSPASSPTPSATPSPTPSPTPTPSPSPSAPSTPTASPTPSPTPTPAPSPTPSPTPTATPSPSPAAVRIQGDANCDGRVTAMDSLQILLELGGLTNSAACAGAADVNCNGHLDESDVLLILDYLSGHAALVAQCPAVGAHI